MGSSTKNKPPHLWRKCGDKPKRQISDIRRNFSAYPTFWDGWVKKGGSIINLRAPLYVRYPLFVAGGLLGLFLVFFIVQQSFTKGEVSDFSPVNCLGNWQYPNHAAGDPETMRGEEFTEANSAFFASTSQQIYCGGFLPVATGTKGIIKNVGLTLAWQIVTTQSATQAPSGDVSVPASQGNVLGASSTDQLNASAPSSIDLEVSSTLDAGSAAPLDKTTSSPSLSVPDATISPPPDTSPSSFRGGGYFASFRSIFFSSAMADEASPSMAGEIATDTIVGVANDTSSIPSADVAGDTGTTTPIVVPPISASLEPFSAMSTSTTPPPENATTSYPVPPAEAPDENFVSISYSTDGESWVELEKVNVLNWPNLTLTLPITSWDDLAKLQILVKGIPTTQNPMPRIFLDGMILEVHYDVPTDTTLQDHVLQDQNQSTTPEDVVRGAAVPDLNGPNPFPDLEHVDVEGTSSIFAQKNDWSGNESPTFRVEVDTISGTISVASSTVAISGAVLGTATTSHFVLDIAASSSPSDASWGAETAAIATARDAPPCTINVIVRTDNTAGGSATPSNFTITMIAGHPAPATFPGDASGTAVRVNADTTYAVNVSDLPGYIRSTGGSCNDSGGLPIGGKATCTVTETFTAPVALPPPDTATSTPTASSTATSSESVPEAITGTPTSTDQNSSSTAPT